jgi:glycosyltransferase involved in cell wall biosynthesis
VDEIGPLPQADARRKAGIDLQDRILVHTGQAAFDLLFTLDCFAEVARHEPRARLMVVGGNRGLTLRAAGERGIQDRVMPFKHVSYSRLGELLACGDVMLLPFADRGLNLGRFPNRLGDFFAAGRPVVTNSIGDVGRLIEGNALGLAVEPTPQATAQAALRVLSDPELAAELGRRGREFAERKMAWRVVAGEVLEFYERLAEE